VFPFIVISPFLSSYSLFVLFFLCVFSDLYSIISFPPLLSFDLEGLGPVGARHVYGMSVLFPCGSFYFIYTLFLSLCLSLSPFISLALCRMTKAK